MIINFFGMVGGQKMLLENVISKLFGGPGGSPSKKNGSKGLVTPKVRKSLPFEPQKIAFKMIH